ncbi:unnamed protein product [Lota lota]
MNSKPRPQKDSRRTYRLMVLRQCVWKVSVQNSNSLRGDSTSFLRVISAIGNPRRVVLQPTATERSTEEKERVI